MQGRIRKCDESGGTRRDENKSHEDKSRPINKHRGVIAVRYDNGNSDSCRSPIQSLRCCLSKLDWVMRRLDPKRTYVEGYGMDRPSRWGDPLKSLLLEPWKPAGQ